MITNIQQCFNSAAWKRSFYNLNVDFIHHAQGIICGRFRIFYIGHSLHSEKARKKNHTNAHHTGRNSIRELPISSIINEQIKMKQNENVIFFCQRDFGFVEFNRKWRNNVNNTLCLACNRSIQKGAIHNNQARQKLHFYRLQSIAAGVQTESVNIHQNHGRWLLLNLFENHTNIMPPLIAIIQFRWNLTFGHHKYISATQTHTGAPLKWQWQW